MFFPWSRIECQPQKTDAVCIYLVKYATIASKSCPTSTHSVGEAHPTLAIPTQVTIAEEGCIPAIVTLLRSSEDVPTQYHALMTLCRQASEVYPVPYLG